jgi:hypothetical protein
MRTTALLIACPALLLLSASFGWFLAPASEANLEEVDSVKATKSANAVSSRLPSSLRKRLQSIRSYRSEKDRMRATIELARNIPLADAGRWLEEGFFSQREGFSLMLFTRILHDRLKEDDPNGFLAWKIRNGGM